MKRVEVLRVGDGNVQLIAGGGKLFTDVAARFCKSEAPIQYITSQPYKPDIVEKIIQSGHKAMLEFDHFIFAVEGFSRVCETQLVRKRHASYALKSNREEKNGKRNFNMVIPDSIKDFKVQFRNVDFDYEGIISLIYEWYHQGIQMGVPEEDLRYLKPQATEFRGLISMNACALRDWFGIRMCLRAQYEIRNLANKMYNLCMDVSPELFKDAGANCKCLGYCPENDFQCDAYKGIIPTKNEAKEILKRNYPCK